MWSGTSSTEDSDDVEKMARYEAETEAEKWRMAQKFSGDRQPGSHSDVRQTCCFDYDKLPDPYHTRMPDLGRRRRKKTKSQSQHCPSCHCSFDTARPSSGKSKYYKNVDAVLSAYEGWLENPESQTFKKPRSNLQSSKFSACSHEPTNAHQPRKRQTSSHRRQCRNEEDRAILAMVSNALNLYENDDCAICYGCLQSMKNTCKSEAPWRDEQMMAGIVKNMGLDRGAVERLVQHKRERILRHESPLPGQRVENANKVSACEKCEVGGHEEEESCRPRGSPRFHPPKHDDTKKIDAKNVADDRKEEENGTADNPYTSNPCGLQASSKNKNGDEPHKISTTIDTNDRSKDGQAQEETENRPTYKPCKRSSTRHDSPCRPDKESTANRDKTIEDTYCELAIGNEEQGTHLRRKYTYACGDLDLRAHKNDMIGLIERVLGNKFGAPLDQQKNLRSNGGATDQGFSMEIMRALQADCTQRLAADVLNHHESKTDCINQLKMLRWEQMKHIQNEFTKLCNLQKFLDNNSPRESLPSPFEPRSDVVATRTDERQQRKHEEKQKLGMIS